jgi:D-glycero-D-manno-heptose 1,7-bisphosphate phosphatase
MGQMPFTVSDLSVEEDFLEVPLLFLDLDDTVRHGFDTAGKFVNGPEDVIVFEEAVVQMQRWKDKGGRIVGISNQGGIALGYSTREVVEAGFAETNLQCNDLFEMVLYCWHHPSDPDESTRVCWCRKPKTGLPIRALMMLESMYSNESYPPGLALFVGDRPEDEECARRLDVRFQWASEWRGSKE